jgi:DNA (cytosine-5)-methyltransferase 1
MSHVDLCSGIGGFALGFKWAGLSKPVLFCDIEPWSRKVLAKHWPDVPIAEDVKELANDPARLVPDCDILTAGYPCQPFSVAGKQRGTEDDRHLWPFISQIIAHKRPAFCVLENVYGHVALGLDEVLADLEAQDYATRAFIVPACAVNAPHRRDRLWIIAANVGNAGCVTKGQSRNGLSEERLNSGTQGQWSVEGHRLANTSENVADTDSSRQQQSHKEMAERSSEQFDSGSFQSRENVADTDNEGSQGRLSGRQGAEWQGEHGHARCSGAAHRQSAKDWWAVEPSMGRVAHGIPGRVDRLKGLGNAIVPQIAMQIGLTIKAVRNA